MPKPLLLRRPAGLYVRFLVPADLRQPLGSRFLVRPLHARGDAARLVAARMGVALSGLFAAIRGGRVKDPKEALRKALESPDRRDLTLRDVVLPGGAKVSQVEINSKEDARLWKMLNDDGRSLEDIGTLPASFRTAPPAPALPPLLLSKAIADHIQDMENARRRPGTILDRRNTLALLLDLIGDLPVSELSADHLRGFLRDMRYWPANARKLAAYRDMTPTQVVAHVRADPAGVDLLADRTLNKHRDQLAHFFSTLEEQGDIARSPLTGLPRHKTDQANDKHPRGRFAADELARIFDPANFLPWAAKYPHRWWGPLLGVASGARLNEIAQLYVEDIHQVDATWGMAITNERPDQHTKSGAKGRRFIPFHQGLLAGGFLRYVEDARAAGHARLFPHLPHHSKSGYGDALGDQFRNYVHRLGITKPGRGFHSYRHGTTSEMVHRGHAISAASGVTGHSMKLPGAMATYVDLANLPDRVRAVNDLDYPSGIPAYETGQFEYALTEGLRVLLERRERRAAKR